MSEKEEACNILAVRFQQIFADLILHIFLFKIFLRKWRACLCTTFGHTVNGSVRGSAEEVFNRVKNQRNNSLFLRTIQLFGEETEIIVNTGDMAMGISRPYYPENILNIPLNRLESIQKSQMMAVGFENMEKHGVEKVKFRLLDRSLVTRRPLVSLGQFYEDLIVIESQSKYHEYHYNVVLEQTRFLEDDDSKNCINFPTTEFEDYQSCDDSFQKEYLQRRTPYKPFWAFGELSNEEPNRLFLPFTHMPATRLYIGATRSPCPLPCTTTVAKTRLRFDRVSEEKFNWIVFYLPEEVRVTETLNKDTSIGQILSDIGGTLGLWLGLGILQLFQSFAALRITMCRENA